MTKKPKKQPAVRWEQWTDELPIVGEIKDCRQLSKNHWRGIDVANGELIDVHGGAMPRRLLAVRGWRPVGLICVTPAGQNPYFRR
jgi:hypothetical protein